MSEDTRHTFRHHPHQQVAIQVFAGAGTAARHVAEDVRALIEQRQAEGRPAVLGLATGSTPIPVYEALVQMHREEGLSFRQVTTFNLDEYYPMEPDHPQSYVRYMRHHLFDHVDIDPERVHIPDGTVPRDEVAAYCQGYEAAIEEAGGIDMQLLGIGRNGHIGFNEPGAPAASQTRLVALDERTREDAAPAFGGLDQVPTHAITMGLDTILNVRAIRLMAWGDHKARIIKKTMVADISSEIPATFLKEHPNVDVYLDEDAAEALPD